MSGIAGIVRLDGASPAPGVEARLTSALAHRGPDGGATWRLGPAVLAHARLHATPEARFEAQPRVDRDVALVADVRLDDRPALLAALGIPAAEGATLGDDALLLAAYRRWGVRCPAHLEGDFAFVVWDRRPGEERVFCARDHFGVKQLVYACVDDRVFAFGSEPRALLALDEVPRRLDERRIAEFVSIQFEDAERTFHHAIRRLPGGCTLTLRHGAPVVERYWAPDPTRELRCRDDREYADGYAEQLRRAVRTRMRVVGGTRPGAMLSGGLDSSSIACLAREERAASGGGALPVFTWIFSDAPEADERAYQDAVIAGGGFERHTLDSATNGLGPWSDVEALLPDGPPYAPNHYLNGGAAARARGVGVRALLDGLGGDGVVSHGTGRFVELFVRGRPLLLARELRAYGARREPPVPLPRLFAATVMRPLLPPSALALSRRLRGRAAAEDPSGGLLRASLVGALAHTRPIAFRPPLSARQAHLAQLVAPLSAHGLELFDRVHARAGVEGRYPFFDRRLAEYCLALPAAQKLAGGWSRVVARRAMERILPPAVQWRTGKGKPGLHVVPALRANRARTDDLFLRDPSALAPYVDVDVLRAVYRDFAAGQAVDLVTAVRLWSVAVLGLWLRGAPHAAPAVPRVPALVGAGHS